MTGIAQHPPGSGVTPEYGRFFLGPSRAVVPKPTDEADRCNLGHLTPKALQKALYVGLCESGRPLQVAYFGWFQFPVPEARLAGLAGLIYGLTPYHDADPHVRWCGRREGNPPGDPTGWSSHLAFVFGASGTGPKSKNIFFGILSSGVNQPPV